MSSQGAMNLLRSTIVITKSQMNTCGGNTNCGYGRLIHGTQGLSNSEAKNEGETKADEPLRLEDITAPTNCCMSGCANCVWIQYAEQLSNVLEKSDVDLQKVIMEKVQDPNMRAFLSMELRCRNLLK